MRPLFMVMFTLVLTGACSSEASVVKGLYVGSDFYSPIEAAQSAIRSLKTRVTRRPSPLAGGRETKPAHSLERFVAEPLSQAGGLRLRNRWAREDHAGRIALANVVRHPAIILNHELVARHRSAVGLDDLKDPQPARLVRRRIAGLRPDVAIESK